MKYKYLITLFKRLKHLQPRKKIQIKTTLKLPPTPVKMTKINSNKQKDNDKSWHGFTFVTGSGSSK